MRVRFCLKDVEERFADLRNVEMEPDEAQFLLVHKEVRIGGHLYRILKSEVAIYSELQARSGDEVVTANRTTLTLTIESADLDDPVRE